jgi:uncharacterized iron-regulated protein
MMKHWSIALFLVLLLLVTGSPARQDRVLRVRDNRIISFDQMIGDLKKVSVVFVGEFHDAPEDHEAQLAIIRAFHEADLPMAIGLEMFRADSRGVLDSWVSGKLSLQKFLPEYYDNWGMPWPLYRDIFLYAREHELPLLGLNISSSLSRKVAAQGFASLTTEEKKDLPPGISCSVDPTYREFIKKAYVDHARHHGKDFENFCEAQMIWDKSMAWHLLSYRKQNPGRSIVVLAGIGHAWKRGIPEQMIDAGSKLTYRVVLPSVPHQLDRKTVTTGDADYLILID